MRITLSGNINEHIQLTKARQGMVIIVVPNGDSLQNDGTIYKTRLPEFYDTTYEYLCNIGLDNLDKIEN